MSKEDYQGIRDCLNRMLEIEFNSSIKEMKDVYFFIDDEHSKLIVKNYNDEIDDITDYISWYMDVNNYEYIQKFQYLYEFNECEIIEFDLN